RKPFRTRCTWWRDAKSRATSTRRACISAVVWPDRRAISPGCGVRTRVRPPARKVLMQPAKAFKPSASRTTGRSYLLTAARTISAVSGALPMPGPMARTDLPSTSLSSRPPSSARSEIAPESVSGSGSVMNSMPRDATTGKALSAVATVTRPAPARNAARAARAAAPVSPTEPARIRTCPKVPLCASSFRGCAIHALPGGRIFGSLGRAGRRQALEVDGSIAFHFLRVRQQYDARVDPLPPQQARHHQTVSAVVPAPAQDRDPLLVERPETLGEKLQHAATGVFHKRQAGDAVALRRDAVDALHLRGGQYLHKESVSLSVLSCQPSALGFRRQILLLLTDS